MKTLGNAFGLSVADLALLDLDWSDLKCLITLVSDTEGIRLFDVKKEIAMSLEVLDKTLSYKRIVDNPIIKKYNEQAVAKRDYERAKRKAERRGETIPEFSIPRSQLVTTEMVERAKKEAIKYDIVIPDSVSVVDFNTDKRVTISFNSLEKRILKTAIENITNIEKSLVKNIDTNIMEERKTFRQNSYTLLIEKATSSFFFFRSYLTHLEASKTSNDFRGLEEDLLYLTEKIQPIDGVSPSKVQEKIFTSIKGNKGKVTIIPEDSTNDSLRTIINLDGNEGYKVFNTLSNAGLISTETNIPDKLTAESFIDIFNLYNKINTYTTFEGFVSLFNIKDITEEMLIQSIAPYKAERSKGNLDLSSRRMIPKIADINSLLGTDTLDTDLLNKYIDNEISYKEYMDEINPVTFDEDSMWEFFNKLAMIGFGFITHNKGDMFLESFNDYKFKSIKFNNITNDVLISNIKLVLEHYQQVTMPVGGDIV